VDDSFHVGWMNRIVASTDCPHTCPSMSTQLGCCTEGVRNNFYQSFIFFMFFPIQAIGSGVGAGSGMGFPDVGSGMGFSDVGSGMGFSDEGFGEGSGMGDPLS